MKLKGLIFDLDGTLLNTLPVCYIGFKEALNEYLGRDYSDEEIAALFGPTEEGIFQNLLPDRWEEALACYLDAYDRAHADYKEPFAGIEAALDLLLAKKVKLAIVSGKGAGSMALSLKHTGLDKYFTEIETGSIHGPNKPMGIKKILELWDCKPEDTAYIGDTPRDIIDSKEVGTLALGAVWAGTSRTEGVSEMKPDVVFHQVEEFINWIEINVEFN